MGEGSLTIESKFYDSADKELSTIQTEGRIGSGFFGGSYGEALDKAAEKIAEGDLARPVPQAGPDEVGRLVIANPDITPVAARFQAPRVAAARGMPLADVLRLIAEHTQGRTLGVLGEPRVNVLELNLALDRATA